MKLKGILAVPALQGAAAEAAWAEAGTHAPWGAGWESAAMGGAVLLALAFLGAAAGAAARKKRKGPKPKAAASSSRPCGDARHGASAGAGEPAGPTAAMALRILGGRCPRCGAEAVSPSEKPNGARCGACGLEFDGLDALRRLLNLRADGEGLAAAGFERLLAWSREAGLSEKEAPAFGPELAAVGGEAGNFLLAAVPQHRDDPEIVPFVACEAGIAGAGMWHANPSRFAGAGAGEPWSSVVAMAGAGAAVNAVASGEAAAALDEILRPLKLDSRTFRLELYFRHSMLFLAASLLGVPPEKAFSACLHAAFLLGAHLRLERLGY